VDECRQFVGVRPCADEMVGGSFRGGIRLLGGIWVSSWKAGRMRECAEDLVGGDVQESEMPPALPGKRS